MARTPYFTTTGSPRKDPLMPKLFNISAQYLQPDGPESQSVVPGGGFDFTDEKAVSIGTEWSSEDPRAGLPAENEFKAKRDTASPAPPDMPADAAQIPAVTGEEEQPV